MKSLLLLSPLLPATGNTSTIERLKEHFQKNDFAVTLLCSYQVAKVSSQCYVGMLNSFIKDNCVDGILLLHAVKSGFCILCCCGQHCQLLVKYGIIFGGTDINEDICNDSKFSVMQQCIRNAAFCVSFNKSMSLIAYKHFPDAKIFIHPQALDYLLYEKCKLNLGKQVELKLTCNNSMSLKPVVFVLPCSIRSVKDPLFLVDEFISWKKTVQKPHDVRLLIIGSVADAEYGSIFYQKLCDCLCVSYNSIDVNKFQELPHSFPNIKSSSNENTDDLRNWLHDPLGSSVQYIPALSRNEFFDFIGGREFFALVNTSKSEGMASVLLEAMALKLPVFARNVAGNADIIKDGETGILFTTPQEFISKASDMIHNEVILNKIIFNAEAYVLQEHNPYVEAKLYTSRVNQFF